MVSGKSVTKTVSLHFLLVAEYVPGYALIYKTSSFKYKFLVPTVHAHSASTVHAHSTNNMHTHSASTVQAHSTNTVHAHSTKTEHTHSASTVQAHSIHVIE